MRCSHTAMPSGLSRDLTSRMITAVLKDGQSMAEAAHRFHVSRSSVDRYVHARHAFPAVQRGHYKRRFTHNDEEVIRSILHAENDLYLDELQERIQAALGKSACLATLSRTLHRMRISNKVLQKRPTDRDEED